MPINHRPELYLQALMAYLRAVEQRRNGRDWHQWLALTKNIRRRPAD